MTSTAIRLGQGPTQAIAERDGIDAARAPDVIATPVVWNKFAAVMGRYFTEYDASEVTHEATST